MALTSTNRNLGNEKGRREEEKGRGPEQDGSETCKSFEYMEWDVLDQHG